MSKFLLAIYFSLTFFIYARSESLFREQFTEIIKCVRKRRKKVPETDNSESLLTQPKDSECQVRRSLKVLFKLEDRPTRKASRRTRKVNLHARTDTEVV